MTAWFEQLIDACVYELYFPEEFAKGNCVSVALSATELPKLVKGEAPSITLESFFETTYAPAHPVRRAAFFIDTLPMVRVIEGKT
jgi:hypothetical protein